MNRPATTQTYSATANGASWGRRIAAWLTLAGALALVPLHAQTPQTPKPATLEEALLLATDFGVCEQFGFGAAAEALQGRVKARRTWGDCYGHVLVATGRADIMLDPVMNTWDCAALAPIIEEAGGTFTDCQGIRTINGGNAISTNGALFKEVIRIVNNEKD